MDGVRKRSCRSRCPNRLVDIARWIPVQSLTLAAVSTFAPPANPSVET